MEFPFIILYIFSTSTVTAYRAVRQSLNSGTPATLVCRDEQIDTMQDFLSKHLKSGKPGSLYVSGAPGTGKTACLNFLLDEMKASILAEVIIWNLYMY